MGVKASLTWEIVTGTLAPGERILLHSDGLTEARNATEKEFGDAYLEVIAGWYPDASAHSLLETLLGEWRTFIGRVVPDDDVSVAVIRRSPAPS